MAGNLNLTPERGPNVWDKQHQSAGGRMTGAAIGGAVLLAAGTAAAVVGARMLYRAVRAGRYLGPFGKANLIDDAVTEESQASFPASDAPSWSGSGATLDARR